MALADQARIETEIYQARVVKGRKRVWMEILESEPLLSIGKRLTTKGLWKDLDTVSVVEPGEKGQRISRQIIGFPGKLFVNSRGTRVEQHTLRGSNQSPTSVKTLKWRPRDGRCKTNMDCLFEEVPEPQVQRLVFPEDQLDPGGRSSLLHKEVPEKDLQ